MRIRNIKKIISGMLIALSIGTTLCYAETVLIRLTATQEYYLNSSVSAKKATKDNSAIVNLTAGPDRVNAPMLCFVAEYIPPADDSGPGTYSTEYKTETVTIYSCGTTKLYYNPFDYNKFNGKEYRAFIKVVPRSRYNYVTTAGKLTP